MLIGKYGLKITQPEIELQDKVSYLATLLGAGGQPTAPELQEWLHWCVGVAMSVCLNDPEVLRDTGLASSEAVDHLQATQADRSMERGAKGKDSAKRP